MSKFDPILPLTHTDAYKLGHIHMYPEGTTRVLSNFTDRGSRIEGVTETVHFGLQAFLQSWITDAWKPFFAADEDEVASLYQEFLDSILGPNRIGTDHIRALHRLGYLPLRFRSLPEGSLVPLRVPKLTVENTHPDFFWLTNYIETALSAAIWQPATTATIAHRMRGLLDAWAVKTTGETNTDFLCHDFSFRGMGGIEAAAASGAGHLLSFTGSDSLGSTAWIDHNYPGENGFIQGSVPATEHSVATAYGPEGELEYFERLIDENPDGFLSVVSDSYDLWSVLTNILPKLKDKIMARNGRLVIRPDSGNPVDIITGKPRHVAFMSIFPDGTSSETYIGPEAGSPEEKGVFEILWDIFGGTVNDLGYKVLDPHVGVIYGDSITYERAESILERLEAKGFAFSNLVFGVGSYTYQYVTRDTFGSAMKATWVEVNGKGRDIYKDPITDDGLKRSARGRLAVLVNRLTGKYELADSLTEAPGSSFEGGPMDALQTVWEDGEFVRKYSFADVRANLGNL